MKNRVVILGGGESGMGSAVLAKLKGKDVFLSDKGIIGDKYKKVLDENTIQWEEQQHSEEQILNAEEIIKSPGIPDTVVLVKKARELNIPVISEIEFAARYTSAKKICITGSNGKTTTTLLLYHILKNAGLNVGLAGNVGKSFAFQVATENFDYYVLELSSFQLDGMFDFKAEISILLNITPDHLDRYGYVFQNYANSKLRITRNQSCDDFFIYCFDDTTIRGELNKINIQSTIIPFTLHESFDYGAYFQSDKLIINLQNTQFTMSIHELALQGRHNAYNSMAAGIAANVLNIRKDIIRECLSDFQGVEHRLETLIKVHGIQFVNDSKATNVNSTWYALESSVAPVIWIAGGVDKGNDYSILSSIVKEKVKAIICLGVDNGKIHEAFDGIVHTIVDVTSMKDAVKKAYYLGKKGETVLLSPACASFDLFQNYEDRGHQFKQAVRGL